MTRRTLACARRGPARAVLNAMLMRAPAAFAAAPAAVARDLRARLADAIVPAGDRP